MTGDDSGDSALPPCERFTVLDWRPSGGPSQCDVCDQPEAAHGQPGRRTLSGGEIEELRRRMIVERHDRREAEQREAGGQAKGAGGEL